MNQLDKIMEITGLPTQEDIASIKSPFAATMLDSLPSPVISSNLIKSRLSRPNSPVSGNSISPGGNNRYGCCHSNLKMCCNVLKALIVAGPRYFLVLSVLNLIPFVVLIFNFFRSR